MTALILASASVTRQHVLRAAGLDFTAIPSDTDEDTVKHTARAQGATAGETALQLAELKARSIAARHPNALVLGADQILLCEDTWFDKPSNLAAARDQLRALRGKTHTLETALVCVQGTTRIWHHLTRPRLAMRNFTDEFLENYLAAECPDILGSVGAYRLEGPGAQLFSNIEGDFFSILGLPLLPLLDYLRQTGHLPT